MSMIALSLTLLFMIAGFAALVVLSASLRRAFSMAGQLHHALSTCEDQRAFSLRIKELEFRPEKPAVHLRLVSQEAVRRPAPRLHPAMSAAA